MLIAACDALLPKKKNFLQVFYTGTPGLNVQLDINQLFGKCSFKEKKKEINLSCWLWSGRIERRRRNSSWEFFFDPNCSIESLPCECCKNLKRRASAVNWALFWSLFLGAVNVFAVFWEHQAESRNILSSRGTFGQQGDRYIYRWVAWLVTT